MKKLLAVVLSALLLTGCGAAPGGRADTDILTPLPAPEEAVLHEQAAPEELSVPETAPAGSDASEAAPLPPGTASSSVPEAPSSVSEAAHSPAPASAPSADGTGSSGAEPSSSADGSGSSEAASSAEERIEALLAAMTPEEKVGQVFFVRCPETNAREDVETYHLGGFILFLRDFQTSGGGWLTREQVTEKLQSYQEAAEIPLLIGVDEEGGTVVRASRNPNLFPARFRSPQQLAAVWQPGIFAEDARVKSRGLLELGINVNLAPVADVSVNPGDFIYARSRGQDAAVTADYVASVTAAMRVSGIGAVLKHFPGYGPNVNTHTGVAVDNRPLETFLTSDLLPFRAGIAAGGDAAAVLVSHNVVTALDPDLPASLSPAVHELLRRELGFEGVAMTDDLSMDAVAEYAGDGGAGVMALQGGNDLVLTTDYRREIPKVLQALEEGELSREALDRACRRVLRWKMAIGILA